MRPDDVGLGGFDSHALPPRARRAPRRLGERLVVVAGVALAMAIPAAVSAQDLPGARVGVSAPVDSLPAPISPRRAFIYSLLVPGLAQAKLDRPLVGAGFFLVEALSLALVRRTADDLRLAEAYLRDSIPVRYVIDPATGVPQLDSKGLPTVAAWGAPYYSRDLVRTRRLQLEDWKAVLLFNHLIAGAEAFVGAHLWDLPQHVKLRAAPLAGGGVAVGARIGR